MDLRNEIPTIPPLSKPNLSGSRTLGNFYWGAILLGTTPPASAS